MATGLFLRFAGKAASDADCGRTGRSADVEIPVSCSRTGRSRGASWANRGRSDIGGAAVIFPRLDMLFDIAAARAYDSDWPAKFTFEEFWNFTEPLEGGMAANCMFMVQDLQVATAMGITFTGKANPALGLAMAQALTWVFKPEHPNRGALCGPADIKTDYYEVLKHEDIGRLGPGHLPEWKAMTNCRITEDGLKRAVKARIVGNIKYVKTNRSGDMSFGDWDSLPADAQLCIASLTWANGNAFNYPKFQKACREAKWFEAAKECGFRNSENSIKRRQAAQELMMHNAGCATAGAGDPDILHWPNRLTLPAGAP